MMNVETAAVGHPALKVILGRRSIRVFEKRLVEDQAIQVLLESAMAAPSAAGKDPWRFFVLRDRAVLSQIAAALPYGKMLESAPLGMAVCGDLRQAHGNQLSYLLQDCSAAIENLLLAAHAIGLGACWLGVHPREDRVASLRSILKLGPEMIPVSCIALGYPAEQKEARTRFNRDFVHYI